MICTESEVINRMADVCDQHNIEPRHIPGDYTRSLIDFLIGMRFPSEEHRNKFILKMLEYGSKKQTVPAQGLLPAQQGKGHFPH